MFGIVLTITNYFFLFLASNKYNKAFKLRLDVPHFKDAVHECESIFKQKTRNLIK